MKKISFGFILIFVLVGCQQAPMPPLTATRYRLSETPAASTTPPMATHRSQATASPSPTPINLNLPAVPAKMSPHPLALNEVNIVKEMKLLQRYKTPLLNDFVFSPDGKYLAVISEGLVFFVDSKTFEETDFINVYDVIDAIAFNPNDPTMLAIAFDGKVSLWNIPSGKKLTTLEGDFKKRIWAVAYGKAGHIAAIGSDCVECDPILAKMVIWDAKTGKQLYVEREIEYVTSGLAFTNDGKYLAYGGQDGVSLWDAEKQEKLVIPLRSRAASSLPKTFIFNQDETSLFVMNQDNKYEMLQIASGKRDSFDLCDSHLVRSQIWGGCFKNGKIVLFDLLTGKNHSEIDVPDFEKSWGRRMALSPNGGIVAYKAQNVLQTLSTKTSQKLSRWRSLLTTNIQTDMVWFGDQLMYVAAVPNESGDVDLINLETGILLQTYSLPSARIVDFAFRPDQKTVATLDDRNNLILWDIQIQRKLYQTTAFLNGKFPSFTFSPNGSELFFLNESGVLKFLSLEKFSDGLSQLAWNTFERYPASTPYVHRFPFNQLGHLLMLRFDAAHNPVIIDKVTQESKTIPLEQGQLQVEAYALSSDDKLLALGSPKNIFVWDMQTMQQISVLAGHEPQSASGFYGMIRSLSFSPQSDLLVSVGWDNTTRLWNVRTGHELRRLNVCCQVQFTPDGRYLVTAGDGMLRVWGIPTPP